MNTTSNNYSLDLKNRIINEYNKHILSVIEIAKIFSVSKSSVYNWIKLYKENDLHIKEKYTKQTSSFQNLDIRNIILDHIKSNPNFSYLNLIKIIENKTTINICKSTLYNIISDLNLTKKVAKFKKIYGSSDKLNIKKENLKTQIKNIPDNKIISIDEVSFDTNIIHNYGWSLKNVPIIKTIGATYKRVTMICAISNKKVLHYKIINNSATSEIFLDFLKNIPNIKGKYLFLDNACIHHSKIVSKYVQDKKIKLLFNVPYSPEYNPIEIMFSKLKKIVRDSVNNNSLICLKNNIINALKFITSTNLTNFFNYSFSKLRIK